MPYVKQWDPNVTKACGCAPTDGFVPGSPDKDGNPTWKKCPVCHGAMEVIVGGHIQVWVEEKK